MNSFIKSIVQLLKPYVFLILAHVSASLLELFFIEAFEYSLDNLIQNIAFSCSVCTLIWLFFDLDKIKITKIIYIFIFIGTFVEGLYFITFKAQMSSSAIFIALDTNGYELNEFLSFNFKGIQLAYSLILLLVFIFSWKLFGKFIVTPKTQKKLFFQLFVLSLGVILMSRPRVYRNNFPIVFLSSIYEYNQQLKLINETIENKAPFTGIELNNPMTSQTHVVVIGESTSRKHFGLYGYERNTTPMLNKIKDEFLVFDNVISSETFTVGSLVKALMVKDDNSYVGNIIQLFNQAGYKTFWLSNQPPIGMYETLVTRIGLAADISRFITLEGPEKQIPFDGELLAELSEVIQDSSPKKVIFLHLMGTHADYYKRYPKGFSVFNTELDNYKQNIVNQYDNAVIYTDYVISQVINIIREINGQTSMLFFSDHGEEVYDEIDFAGHSVDGILTKNLVEVPFFLWKNSMLTLQNDILSRPFILNDLSHSLADLYGIRANEIDSTRSVFNLSFEIRKRIIRDSVYYD